MAPATMIHRVAVGSLRMARPAKGNRISGPGVIGTPYHSRREAKLRRAGFRSANHEDRPLDYPNEEWQYKGATLSDKTARQEFGLTPGRRDPRRDRRGHVAVPPSRDAREPVAEIAPPRSRGTRPDQARRPIRQRTAGQGRAKARQPRDPAPAGRTGRAQRSGEPSSAPTSEPERPGTALRAADLRQTPRSVREILRIFSSESASTAVTVLIVAVIRGRRSVFNAWSFVDSVSSCVRSRWRLRLSWRGCGRRMPGC